MSEWNQTINNYLIVPASKSNHRTEIPLGSVRINMYIKREYLTLLFDYSRSNIFDRSRVDFDTEIDSFILMDLK